MEKKIQMLTANRTFIQYEKIRPEYVVVHSTASGKDKIATLFRSWNSQAAGKSCHGMVDAEGFAQTLPYDCRGWHVGSSGNGLSVGFEICEPKNIAYADAAHSKIDAYAYNPADPSVRADFLRRYQNAVLMAADMCRETGVKPEKVLCHAEMRAIGKATNHADVHHWFNLFGGDFKMDAFRRDVADILAGKPLNKDFSGAPPASPPGLPYIVKVEKPPITVLSAPDGCSETMTIDAAGSFTIVEEKDGFGRLKSGAGWVELSKVKRK